jgi:hypothetical protein
MSQAKTTTDHKEIRRWAEQRGGRPSIVRRTEGGGGGILRIDFAEPDGSLEEIGWDEFFRIFDERELALLHQDKTEDGKPSRFNKLVHRHTGAEHDHKAEHGAHHGRR